jgi:hypothetical protein
MTHAIFSPDGALFLFADVFGVTRLALGEAVKAEHTGKVSAAVGDLSLDGAGALALVHGRVHTGLYGGHGLATLALPSLELRDELSGWHEPHAITTTAAGDRVVTLRFDCATLDVQALAGGSLLAERTIALAERASRVLDARSVGPQASGRWQGALHVTPDGRFIARGSTAVYAGRIGADAGSDEVWWALPLAVHCAAEVTLAAVGDASWVFVRDAREDVVRALVVARDGAVRELSFASLCPPAVDAQALVTQPDSHTVLARTHADGREQRYDLRAFNDHPAPAPDVAAYPHGPPPAPTRLPGVVATRGELRLFVPWHREAVVDLARGVSYPRGLDAGSGPFRRLLLERFAHLNESIRSLYVEFALLAFEPHGEQPRIGVSSCCPSLPAALASQVGLDYGRNLLERFRFETHGYRWTSFAHEGGHLASYGGAPVDEVKCVLTWMRDHDVLPTDAAAFVARGYNEGMGILSDPRPAAFPFDAAGERLFLRAALALLATGRWPEVASFDGWAAEPVTVAQVCAAAEGLRTLARPRHRDTMGALARMLARHLDAAALPALVALLRAAVALPVAIDDVRQVGEAMTWVVHHHPALRDEALAAVDALVAPEGAHPSAVAFDLALARERVARGARHFGHNA